MHAKMKCSNCGAEMSNLNMSWGWKPLLIMVPIMLLGFLPLLKLTFFQADITKDLTVSDITKRIVDDRLEIIGLITSTGSHNWSGISLEVEFFDSNGAFVDEAQERLGADIAAKAKEHFKMTIRDPSPALNAPDTKMVVKVAGGHTSSF